LYSFLGFLLLNFALLLAPRVFFKAAPISIGSCSVRGRVEFLSFFNEHFFANLTMFSNAILGKSAPAVVARDQPPCAAVLIGQLIILTWRHSRFGRDIVIAHTSGLRLLAISLRWLFHLLVRWLLPLLLLQLGFVLDLLHRPAGLLDRRIAYKGL
jgi:hypothetical protein